MSGRIEDNLKDWAKQPDLELPPDLEARVLGAMASASSSGRRQLARAAALIAAAGIAGLLAAAMFRAEIVDTPGDAVVSDDGAGLAEAQYAELVVLSDYLETLLEVLPQRQIMRVSTAGTIVGLEERIAQIDTELGRSQAVSTEYRTALMRDRVEVMNALVNVRYAQSRVFVF
jgi:hypothetical protein